MPLNKHQAALVLEDMIWSERQTLAGKLTQHPGDYVLNDELIEENKRRESALKMAITQLRSPNETKEAAE